jgi:Flp pilus assembly pilin Flp
MTLAFHTWVVSARYMAISPQYAPFFKEIAQFRPPASVALGLHIPMRWVEGSRAATQTKIKEKQMKLFIYRLWKEEEGQDLTEYALLLVLIALAAIASMKTLSTAISGVFSTATASLTTT